MDKFLFFDKANLWESRKNHLDKNSKKLDEDCIFDNTKFISMEFNPLRTSLSYSPNSLLNAPEK